MKALDPDHGEVVPAQTSMIISYFGNNISLVNANKITAAVIEYVKAQNIAYESITTDYVPDTLATDNASYIANMDAAAAVSIGGGGKLVSAFAAGVVKGSVNIGTIANQTKRYCISLVNGVLTDACVTYLTSADGQAFLATLTA